MTGNFNGSVVTSPNNSPTCQGRVSNVDRPPVRATRIFGPIRRSGIIAVALLSIARKPNAKSLRHWGGSGRLNDDEQFVKL